jgi:hypothetical protein
MGEGVWKEQLVFIQVAHYSLHVSLVHIKALLSSGVLIVVSQLKLIIHCFCSAHDTSLNSCFRFSVINSRKFDPSATTDHIRVICSCCMCCSLSQPLFVCMSAVLLVVSWCSVLSVLLLLVIGRYAAWVQLNLVNWKCLGLKNRVLNYAVVFIAQLPFIWSDDILIYMIHYDFVIGLDN